MHTSSSQLAKQWIDTFQLTNERRTEVAEALDDLIKLKPLDALSTIDEIVKHTDDKELLANVGSGPLEDLLSGEHASEVVDIVLDNARKYPNWRFALGTVWTSGMKHRHLAKKIEQTIQLYFPSERP